MIRVLIDVLGSFVRPEWSGPFKSLYTNRTLEHGRRTGNLTDLVSHHERDRQGCWIQCTGTIACSLACMGSENVVTFLGERRH